MKLSNANPVSTWKGERLTLPGAVDFSGIFVFFLCTCSFFFSHNYVKSKGSYKWKIDLYEIIVVASIIV